MTHSAGQDVLISDLADDPEMLGLVREFVGELSTRMATATAALTGNDMAALRRLAHQLKGAAGGYGFNTISIVAAELEKAVVGEEDVASLTARLEALKAVCARARAC